VSANRRQRQTEPTVRQRHTDTLFAFVVRGRRIEAHSLAQDRDPLTLWARGHMRIRVTRDGQRGEVNYTTRPRSRPNPPPPASAQSCSRTTQLSTATP
jgi:hypothetical protein